MVRVGSSFSVTPNSRSNFITRFVSATARTVSSYSSRSNQRNICLPKQWKHDRTVKVKRSLRCHLMALLVIVAALPWYLSSFISINTDRNTRMSDIDIESNKEQYVNDPLWTTCPPNENTDDREQEHKTFGSHREDICFVTCIFGDNVRDVDLPANVEWFDRHWCHTRFLLVTNLPDLPAPGWRKIVANTTSVTAAMENTQRHIVESRHAKFLAWEVLSGTVPEHCAAVVYMDGYLTPVRYPSWWALASAAVTVPPWSPASPLFPGSWGSLHPRVPPSPKFQAVVRQVRAHPWGLSQVKQKYFDGLPMTTLLRNLVRDRKDTEEHVEKTLEWFRSQATNYQEIMPYYLNKYFAYDPNNVRYRELSSFFWKTYTTYGGLWRDQPLWAYLLHHFNVTPAVMTTKGTITKGGDLFRTGGKLGWDKHVYT